jgi:hypothetical protein
VRKAAVKKAKGLRPGEVGLLLGGEWPIIYHWQLSTKPAYNYFRINAGGGHFRFEMGTVEGQAPEHKYIQCFGPEEFWVKRAIEQESSTLSYMQMLAEHRATIED